MLINGGGTAPGYTGDIQAANQCPRGHLSKDQRAWEPLLEDTTKESGAPGSQSSSRLARRCKDHSTAPRQSALQGEAVVGMSLQGEGFFQPPLVPQGADLAGAVGSM